MARFRPSIGAFGVALILGAVSRGDSALTDDQVKMLKDPLGWEYLDLFQKNNGFPTKHVCFSEGESGSSECQGVLKLHDDGTFVQEVTIQGTPVPRHGTWNLDGDQLTMWDELGTKDGPYTVELNLDAKTMRISMDDAGVIVGAHFKLEREYQKSKSKRQNGKSS
jgi:hypothetical protein